MPANALEVRVQLQDEIAVLHLRGEIDALAEDALEAAYQKTAKWHPAVVLLDLSGVAYINSTGIALIVSILARARKAGTRLLACGLSEHYQEIFRITRLSDFIQIFPDEATALAQAVP
jgi:anti-sigma B factor antagonist